MSDYLDASALVSVLLGEPTSQAVKRTLEALSSEPIVSTFCLGECAAAIAGLVTMKRKTETEAKVLLSALDDWIASSAIVGDVRGGDIADASHLVRRFDLKLRLPDAIHIATARRLQVRLVTLDRRMATAAKTLGIPCINPAESAA